MTSLIDRIGGEAYEAALGLAWLSESGCHAFLRLIGLEGPQRVWSASEERLLNWGMTPGAVARFMDKRRCFDLSKAKAVLDRQGVRFVPFGSHHYPRELAQLCLPPAGLFVRGSDEALEQLAIVPRVTIVGTRKASAHGLRAADAFASMFALNNVVVVSGMALGIDARAHEAALHAGGLTVAVVGCGVDVVYPRRHASLRQRIVERGIVLSELPPGTSPSKWTFPHRNRLLAALGDAVLVVEGSCISGALQTVDRALELGRTVFSVPGPVLVEGNTGCNRLLYEGAFPAIDPCVAVEDFFSLTRMERGERRRYRNSCNVAVGRGARCDCDIVPGPDTRQKSVLEALNAGPCSVDELVACTGLAVRELTAALAELELQGCTARAGPGKYIRAP